MIVDQAVYSAGTRRPCEDVASELDRLRDGPEKDFLWIGVKEPHSEEFLLMQDALSLHPLAVEDALTGDQRAKVEVYDDTVFVVLKTLVYIDETSQVETGELMLFVGPHFVLTVRRGEHSGLSQIRHSLEHTPELLAHGPIAVLHKVMDNVVDQYVRVDAELAYDLEQLEEKVFSPSTEVDVAEIYLLKREVLEMRRAASPLVEPLSRVMRSRHVPSDAVPFFRDVNDHLLHVVDRVDSYDRLLSDVLNAHLAQVSVNQNADMRKISAWVAIAALPTMVSAIYGMNFEGMPELTASVGLFGREFYYGYPLALAVMAGGCIAIYRAFKRSGWL
ncbi:magnesium and cobalt transport protein CorA [Demetria terragena]|uniref:magnesium and cobalt transport protein CorA n=1 Tax=Demetria terragena TaxID=63959 RepID=UPI0003798F44|nr:magnesium and cobalt transport protein CorA [Demetria terragena]